LIIKEK